jgi:hypothetical protein
MSNIDFQNGFALGLVAVGKAGSAVNIPTAINNSMEIKFMPFQFKFKPEVKPQLERHFTLVIL